MSSPVANLLRCDFASIHYGHLASVVQYQNQRGEHEEIAVVTEHGKALNPSRRVKGALTREKFEVDCAHEGSKLEEVEMALEDRMVHPAAGSNPYAPTHDDPN